jgi:hypothetical protein
MKMHYSIDGKPACGQNTTVHVAGCVTTYKHHVDCARCIARWSKSVTVVVATDIEKQIKKATRRVNEAKASLERVTKHATGNVVLSRDQIIANHQADLAEAEAALNALFVG